MKINYLFILILSFLIFGCKGNYEKGVDNLKEKNYQEAITQFNKIDSSNENYSKAISKINYIQGLIAYNDKKYVNSYNYLKLVKNDDEYYNDSKKLVDSLEKKSEIIFEKANYYLSKSILNESTMEENMDINLVEAIDLFKKIKPGESKYLEAQSKIDYINGIVYYNSGFYDLAAQSFNQVRKEDSCYGFAQANFTKIKQEIDKQKQNEQQKENDKSELTNYYLSIFKYKSYYDFFNILNAEGFNKMSFSQGKGVLYLYFYTYEKKIIKNHFIYLVTMSITENTIDKKIDFRINVESKNNE